jgi:hypothetical protein
MTPRVWILGAGFSRPLGAPLLNDLLSENTRHEIHARFNGSAGLVDDAIAEKVYDAVRRPLGHTNVEELLEFLDAAATPDTPQARRVAVQWPGAAGKCDVLSRRARRIVAAECCAFLESNPVVVGTRDRARVCERWLPYATWGWNLTAADTMITFNYDRLLENLREELTRAAANGAEWDHGPPLRVVEVPADLSRPGAVKVLKVHGSVDWLLDGAGGFRVARGNPWLTADELDLAIGTPGPGKLHAATGPFAWLWKAACEAIRAAKEVILVGYRFPETDSFARNQILDALRDSSVEQVQVVLGPHSPDAPRVQSLIRMTRPAKVVTRPLWSQDFLDVWRPQ